MNGEGNALRRLEAFLLKGVSAFHAAEEAARLLQEAGCSLLRLSEPWHLKAGGKYVVRPFDTTLYAFSLGEKDPLAGQPRLAGAHLDWPTLKIKPAPEMKSKGYLQLNTEVYGGPILNTWFDRPLGLAGKLVWRDEEGRMCKTLVDLPDSPVYLPNLAVHMNRNVNENGQPIDRQKDLMLLAGLCPEDGDDSHFFSRRLEEVCDLKENSLLDWDLCLYNPQQPASAGMNGEFLAAPRLDDLTSVCALVYGFLDASPRLSGVNMVCLVDNEEIGSRTKQGADSDLPGMILRKLWASLGRTGEDCMCALPGGMILSVDVAHAYHPNYPGKQDITNVPLMGKGLMLKSASNQSYTWDCDALGWAVNLCRNEEIPYQRFVKRSDQAGGGTIGSIISSHLPTPTVDMGVGLLAMHSACEVMGKQDQQALEDFVRAFYSGR